MLKVCVTMNNLKKKYTTIRKLSKIHWKWLLLGILTLVLGCTTQYKIRLTILLFVKAELSHRYEIAWKYISQRDKKFKTKDEYIKEKKMQLPKNKEALRYKEMVDWFTEIMVDSIEIEVIRRAKVAPNNKSFLIHEEKRSPEYKHLQSEISFYDEAKTVLWSDGYEDSTKIVFELSDIYDSVFIVTVSDVFGREPELYLIDARLQKRMVIEKGTWMRILSYAISPNCRFFVAHMRRLHFRKPCDYIFFIDLRTEKTWEYLFPTCVSCKRARITLDIDDNGQAEVVYKAEHRIFSKEGKLTDIYLKIE